MGTLRGIFILALILAPLFFQIIFGCGFIPVSRKMKFWLICVISFLLIFVTYFINAKIMSYCLEKSGIRDGMPFVALLMTGMIMTAAIVLTIVIQLLVKYFKNRKKVLSIENKCPEENTLNI